MADIFLIFLLISLFFACLGLLVICRQLQEQ